MLLGSRTRSQLSAVTALGMLSSVGIACRIRDNSGQEGPLAATNHVPVVQLEEIAAHPLDLLAPVTTIPELRAPPGPGLAVLVASRFDDVVTDRTREAWEATLNDKGLLGTPFDLMGRAVVGLENSPLFEAGRAGAAGLVFEAAVMDSAADFGAVAGVPEGHHPGLLALRVLHSDSTLASYATAPASPPDAGASRNGTPEPAVPHVVAAMIVRSAAGELGAVAEMGAPPTFPLAVGSVALPGGALHVEGGVAVIVLGNDPWFARNGFARKLHAHHAASSADPTTSLDWARQHLDGHRPLALALVTRRRQAVWTAPEAFSVLHIWEPSRDSADGRTGDALGSSAAAPAQPSADAGTRSPDAAGTDSPSADAGSRRWSAP